jgi:glycosyltransferase involved in cell wall biosynthesis
MKDKKQMNLLLLCPVYPPYTGGSATYGSILVESFTENSEITTYLLTEYCSDAPLVEHKNDNLHIYRVLAPREMVKADAWLKRKFIYLCAQFTLLVLMPLFIFFGKIDLIHLNGYFGCEKRYSLYNPLYPLLKLIKTPLLMDIRENFSIPGDTAPYDRIICITEQIKEKILRKGQAPQAIQQKIELIPCLFKPTELPKSNALEPKLKDRQYICYVGSIRQTKGVYVLLEAFRKTVIWETGTELIYIGKDITEGHFPRQAEDIDQVHYLGSLPHEEVLQYINHSELLVLPSYSEGMPRVCMESIHLGTKFIFPASIRELNQYFPEWSLDRIEANTLAEKIDMVVNQQFNSSYPLGDHYPENVIVRVKEIYEAMMGERDD